MWLEMRMAWSSSQMKLRNSSKISSRTTGSSPAVASSRISSLGWWARAAAKDNFIFMPRENSLMSFSSGSLNFFR